MKIKTFSFLCLVIVITSGYGGALMEVNFSSDQDPCLKKNKENCKGNCEWVQSSGVTSSPHCKSRSAQASGAAVFGGGTGGFVGSTVATERTVSPSTANTLQAEGVQHQNGQPANPEDPQTGGGLQQMPPQTGAVVQSVCSTGTSQNCNTISNCQWNGSVCVEGTGQYRLN